MYRLPWLPVHVPALRSMLTAPGRDACAADLEEYFALLRIMGRPLSEVDPTTPGGVCSTEGCVRKECTLVWQGRLQDLQELLR